MTTFNSNKDIQLWSEPSETPTLKKDQIVFTAGSTVKIDAPAEKVFKSKVIIEFEKYKEWNRWCPKFEFKQDEQINVGSKGIMHVMMKEQNRTFEIPEEILELENGSSNDQFKISWRGGLLPSWAGKAERVQIVTSLENGCQLKQWESMSGFASYIFKYAMGIPKQLQDSNLLYSEDIKKRAEELHRSNNAKL